MDRLMTLPTFLVEKLESEEMVFVNGGSKPVEPPANNGSGTCSGTNNGSGTCK